MTDSPTAPPLAVRDVPAPFGALRVVAGAAGVRAVQFRTAPPPPADHVPAGRTDDDPSGLAESAAGQLADYLAGDRTRFELPLDWGDLGPTHRRVLTVLADSVGFGATITYGELATRAGLGVGAARVVGQMMGSNPIPVVVPCHRVVAGGGQLGGFGGGLETKRWLLELEGSLPPRLPW